MEELRMVSMTKAKPEESDKNPASRSHHHAQPTTTPFRKTTTIYM
jgi:hypothetical protein